MKIKDYLCLPLRVFLSNDRVSSLGLTSVLEERINVCAKHTVGPVLDIACGEGNFFIRTRKFQGYGLDIFPFEEIDVCAEATYLPFKENCFQTVCFIGSFNYMKNPGSVLKEVSRVLDKDGTLLITITNEFFCRFRHAAAYWISKQVIISDGLRYSYSNKELKDLLEANNFVITGKIRYLMGVSILYVVKYANPNKQI